MKVKYLLVVMAIVLVLVSVQAAAPSVQLDSPSGGTYSIGDILTFDFNLSDADINGLLTARLFYSLVSGGRENSIIDFNVSPQRFDTSHTDIIFGAVLDDYNRSLEGDDANVFDATTGYDFNTGIIRRGIDVNGDQCIGWANDYERNLEITKGTLNFWTKRRGADNTSTYETLLYTNIAGFATDYLRFRKYFNLADNLRFEVLLNGDATITCNSDSAWDANEEPRKWHMITLQWDVNSGCDVFVDKVNVATSSTTSLHNTYNNSQPIVFGGGWDNSACSNEYDGQFDEIGIYNEVLSGADINLLYDQVWDTFTYCPDFNSSTANPYNCQYSWDTDGVSADDYYADVNILDQTGETAQASSAASFELGDYTYLRFYDENTGAGLPDVTVTIDGNTFAPDANGVIVLDTSTLPWESKSYPIVAFDDDHTTRNWNFDLNDSANLDVSLALLDTNRGATIDFKFYDDSDKIMSNQKIEVYIENEKYASIKTTSSTGTVSLFLNPNDMNYLFRLNDANYYYPTLIVVKVPRDEKTNIALPVGGDVNYTVSVDGIGSRNFSGLSGDASFFILNNTVSNYIINIDYNASYYARNIYLNLTGDPPIFTIQPYLASAADAVSTTVYTRNYSSQTTRPGIKIISKKFVPDGGFEEIESVITDSKGEALMSFIVNDTYTLELYDDNGTTFLGTKEIIGTSTTLYIYVDILEVIWSVPAEPAIIFKFVPDGGTYTETTIVYIDVNITNSTIIRIDVNVSNDANRNDNNYFWTNSYTAGVADGATIAVSVPDDINASGGINIEYGLHFTVHVTTIDGTVYASAGRDFFYALLTLGGQDYMQAAREGTRESFGCSTDGNTVCPMLLIISLLLGMFATGYIMVEFGIRGRDGMAIIWLAILALFAWLTWIPPSLYIMMVVIAGIVLIADHRRGY